MIMFGAPLLATKWFEDSKRVIVICFTYMIAFLASDHSFGVNRWVLDNVGDNDEKALFVLFSIKASLSLLICIITFLTFRSKPSLPPSEAATVYRDNDILGTIRQLYANKQFMLLSLTHVFYFTAFNIMRKNVEEMIVIYNSSLSDDDKYNLTMCLTSGGILGTFSLGVFLYLTQYYKTANIFIGILSIVSWILILFVFKKDFTSISIAYGFIGFSSFTITPFWLIYSVEVAYPLKETTVVGLVKGIASGISSAIAYTLYHFLLEYHEEST